jgi:hypothetical protein
MIRFTWLAMLLLAACAPMKAVEKQARGYAGTVQKVFQIVRQGDVPGMRFLGLMGSELGPVLRQSSETRQYVVRTPTGQIIAQSDDEFFVGDCVEVIPQDDAASGPAFRYGQAQIVRSDKCTS